jgi:biopolymer transport protein ExbD
MRKPRFKEKFNAEINIVPFTDVLLVLLVIFMVTTPMIIQGQIKVNLPKAASQSEAVLTPITLTLTAGKKLFMDDQEIAFKDLGPFLKKRLEVDQQKLVIINADERVAHGEVVRLLDAAKDAGALRLAVATEQK